MPAILAPPPQQQPSFQASVLLPAAVDRLLADLASYLAAYEELMHAKVRQSRAFGRDGDGTDAVGADDDDGSQPAVPSPLDALCFNSASFAGRELCEAVTDIARLARRIVHTEASSLAEA